MAVSYAQIKPGDNLSNAQIRVSNTVAASGGYTPQTIFITDTGATIKEGTSGGYLSVILELPGGLEIPIYEYLNDGEPPVYDVLPEEMGTVVSVNDSAAMRPFVTRVANAGLYGYTEDKGRVDISALYNKRISRMGSDSQNVTVGTVSCSVLAEYLILSESELYTDIKLTGSIKYTPANGLMDSPAISIPVIPGVLKTGESVIARNISVVARENNSTFEYILTPYDVNYSGGAVSFKLKGYKPNDTISGTAKTVATYISVHIAGLLVGAS